MSVLNIGAAGLASATGRMEEGARRVAAGVLDPATADATARAAAEGRSERGGTASDLVDVQRAARDAEANARVVRSADEVLGTLLDTRA